ncbi:MAG: tRNA modification GTPase, partial [Proteobacteria bacterium]|nr:tRNA modification GTPase [Pseudomonadota bacterium]
MSDFASGETIAAIATPPGAGGVGVVRVSGPAAFSILERIWRGRVRPSKFEPRKLYLGRIVSEPGTSDRGPVLNLPGPRFQVPGPGFIDRVLAVKMPAPRTYTGDDVVEISCHGSQPVLSGIVAACVAAGARVAGPGEFTRRAFLAGKMDLAQAEAVADLIAAQGDRAARVAAMQLDGRLSREIREIAGRVAGIRAQVEASIDFPDEGIDGCSAIAWGISAARDLCERLSSTFGCGRMMKEGVRVAIAGRPNAGKSSLLNRIVGRDRALVHREPGTTRDVVEGDASIGGVRYTFCDTAGLRAAGCEVESLGVGRSLAEIASADIALLVFDGSREFSGEDREVIARASGRKAIFVVNKSDLPQRFDIEEL